MTNQKTYPNAQPVDQQINPLYPVPVLMNASELEPFYYMLMKGEDENDGTGN